MTQPLFLRHALGFATLACLACLPAAASAVEINDIFAFKGTATDIGVQRGPGQIGGIEYRIEGKFDYDGPLDLTRSTVTFHHFLDEHLPGGNGEMVLTTDNADLVCPEPQSPADSCWRRWPLSSLRAAARGSRPSTRRRAGSGRRCACRSRTRPGSTSSTSGSIAAPRRRSACPNAGALRRAPPFPADRQFPKLCGVDPLDKSKRATTDIRTSFTISDGVNEPVVLDFVKAWECSQPGRYHLRSR